MPKKPAYLRSLFIVYAALIAGQALFLGVSLFLVLVMERATIEELGNLFLPVGVLLSAGSITGGYVIFRKKMQTLAGHSELEQKLIGYRSALVIRFALFESPTLLNTLFYLLSGNLYLLFLAVLALLHFIGNTPTQEKLIRDLQLDFGEQMKLDDPSRN